MNLLFYQSFEFETPMCVDQIISALAPHIGTKRFLWLWRRSEHAFTGNVTRDGFKLTPAAPFQDCSEAIGIRKRGGLLPVIHGVFEPGLIGTKVRVTIRPPWGIFQPLF